MISAFDHALEVRRSINQRISKQVYHRAGPWTEGEPAELGRADSPLCDQLITVSVLWHLSSGPLAVASETIKRAKPTLRHGWRNRGGGTGRDLPSGPLPLRAPLIPFPYTRGTQYITKWAGGKGGGRRFYFFLTVFQQLQKLYRWFWALWDTWGPFSSRAPKA